MALEIPNAIVASAVVLYDSTQPIADDHLRLRASQGIARKVQSFSVPGADIALFELTNPVPNDEAVVINQPQYFLGIGQTVICLSLITPVPTSLNPLIDDQPPNLLAFIAALLAPSALVRMSVKVLRLNTTTPPIPGEPLPL